MEKEIKQFRKSFLTYVREKREEDVNFYNDEPIVSFEFGGDKVFIKMVGEKRYRVGYLGNPLWETVETLDQCFNWLKAHLDTESKYDYAKRMVDPLCDRIRNLQSKLYKTEQTTTIKKVIHNKGTTVVWFEDNEKVIVKKRKGVRDSIYSAVAYAIAKRLYCNNTNFKKKVDEVVVCNAKK